MSVSTIRHCSSGPDNTGVATTVEYVLLAGVSVAILLSLSGALSVFSASTRDDATAIAAFGVASSISSSVCEATGTGEVSASMAVDLPGLICGMPYVAYPSQDGRSIVISVSSGTSEHRYAVPLPVRANSISIDGFIASPPSGHQVGFNATSRTVILS